jgi:hypothetical protein
MQWGDAVYRHGAFVEDDQAEIAENPALEVDRTRSYLKSLGYQSGNWWNVARLARVADPEGKTEIILFYQEALDLAPGGAPPASDSDLPESDAKALFERMNAAVKPDKKPRGGLTLGGKGSFVNRAKRFVADDPSRRADTFGDQAGQVNLEARKLRLNELFTGFTYALITEDEQGLRSGFAQN